MLHACLEVSSVGGAIAPLVLPKALRLPRYILAHILVPVFEEITAVTMSEVLEPLALEFVFVFPSVHAVPLCFTVDPLANIGIAARASPDPVTVFDPEFPFSVVYLPIGPTVDTFTMGLPLLVTAMVDVPICKDLIPMALPLVQSPLAFIGP